MVTLDLSNVTASQCAKPNCTRRHIERHHKGCEHMWLKHFKAKRRTKRFRTFRDRYYEYRPEDCVPICRWHHQEVHEIYIRIIHEELVASFYTPCAAWSWEQAEALMSKLRTKCDEWLKLETPGSEPVRRHIE